MKKEYRIKTKLGPDFTTLMFTVQVKSWIGKWVDIKNFYDPGDPEFARLEAEELLEKLEEN